MQTLWQTLKQAYALWAEEDCDQRSAAFGYYLLLSLLPFILLVVAVASLFFEREEAAQSIVALINNYTPLTGEQERGVVSTIHEWLDTRGKVSLATLPLLIWGSMKYIRTLVRTTNRLWKSKTYNWWRLPLKSLGLLGITVSAVLIGILLPAIVGLAGNTLTNYLEIPEWAFSLIFLLVPSLALFYGLIMIYKLAPRRSTRFSEVWLGALVTTLLIWLGERLFVFYASSLTDFSVLYGALGGIVAFLLWLYLMSCLAVFGICLNAALAEVRAGVSPHSENDQASAS